MLGIMADCIPERRVAVAISGIYVCPSSEQKGQHFQNSLTSPGPLNNLMHRCGPRRDVDIRTESNEMPRQGDMSVIYDFAVPVSADATINKRIAIFIDVVY